MKKTNASELFQAIGEKSRLHIINLCFAGEQSFDDLLRKTKIEKTLLSKHLKVLRDAEIITVEREGRQATYSLNKTICIDTATKTLSLPCCDIKLK